MIKNCSHVTVWYRIQEVVENLGKQVRCKMHEAATLKLLPRVWSVGVIVNRTTRPASHTLGRAVHDRVLFWDVIDRRRGEGSSRIDKGGSRLGGQSDTFTFVRVGRGGILFQHPLNAYPTTSVDFFTFGTTIHTILS